MADQAPQAPVVPPAPVAVPFALVPGAIPGVINFGTRQGLAIYSEASRTLYQDPADSFSVESAGLQTFLSLLKTRGGECGWDFGVPQDMDDPTVNLLDVITHHGRFTIEHLREFAISYVTNHVRGAQDNMQICKCITASLSLPGFRKVDTWKDHWHYGDIPCYVLLVKVIVREAFIDTQATTRILREQLSSLPTRLAEVKGDIEQLNAFVKLTQDQLAARGETTQDLLANLFKGYLTSGDRVFRSYIEKKQEDYDDGVVFTVDSLMNLASNKFKTLVQAGKWMAPSSSSSAPANRNRTGDRRERKPIAAWMERWPGKTFVDNNQTKTVDGKVYWWCKKHKRFVQHKTSECRMQPGGHYSGGNNNNNNNSSGRSNGNNNGNPPTIRVSSAVLMEE
jgi:hypothetical protein